MEQFYSPEDMIHQLDVPAFIVQSGIICAVNAEAKKLFVEKDTPIEIMIHSGLEEYRSTQAGCLVLSVEISGVVYPCTVNIYDSFHLFKPRAVPEPTELKALALAAEQLRIPFSDLSLLLDRTKGISDEQRAKLTHNISKIERLLSNMSDSATVTAYQPKMVSCNIPEVLNEAVEKSISLLAGHPIKFSYSPSNLQIMAKGNPQLLKRAVYNMISNAVKFADEGSTVEITLKRVENKLHFTVANTGSCISSDIFPTVFSRYSRIAGIEDPRNGLGLGISLIYGTATAHNGTLFIESPGNNSTRVTMILGINKDQTTDLRTPFLTPDFYGGLDQALIELSDILSYQAYLE